MPLIRLLVAASLLAPFALHAQQLPPSLAVLPKVPTGHSNMLSLDVAVTNKSGKPVRGLQQQDFTLLEDKKPRALRSFTAVDLDAGTPAPATEVALVVDEMNADITKAGREREGIVTFLRANQGHLPVPVSLFLVSDARVTEPIAASQDGNAVAAALEAHETGLRSIRQSSMGGAFDRFRLSLVALQDIVQRESAKPGRKLVVWVSPGWPMLARASADITSKNQQECFGTIVNLSTAMRDGHITLYQVVSLGVEGSDVNAFGYYKQFISGVKKVSQAYPPNLALSVLAVQSGGLVLDRSNDLPAALAAEIAQSANDARVFYVLQFEAANGDRGDEYHALEVTVDRPGLTARTRTGYYAQP
jgi:VWFA-related protein